MSNQCLVCSKQEKLISAVYNGKYGLYCKSCLSRQNHVGSADYARQADRDAHEADMVQPWKRDGSPNRDYARLYPNMVDEMYSEEGKREL